MPDPWQGYHDIVSVVFLTLPKELHLPVTEKLSLHRVRDSMGPNLDPVVGLLRYVFVLLSFYGLLIPNCARVLKKLLRLVDHQFAESLERYALHYHNESTHANLTLVPPHCPIMLYLIS